MSNKNNNAILQVLQAAAITPPNENWAEPAHDASDQIWREYYSRKESRIQSLETILRGFVAGLTTDNPAQDHIKNSANDDVLAGFDRLLALLPGLSCKKYLTLVNDILEYDSSNSSFNKLKQTVSKNYQDTWDTAKDLIQQIVENENTVYRQLNILVFFFAESERLGITKSLEKSSKAKYYSHKCRKIIFDRIRPSH